MLSSDACGMAAPAVLLIEFALNKVIAHFCNSHWQMKESVQSVLEQMGHPTLGQRASFGVENHGSRVMAAQFASGEEQLCENPRYSLGPF
jgi:hypothetical protein